MINRAAFIHSVYSANNDAVKTFDQEVIVLLCDIISDNLGHDRILELAFPRMPQTVGENHG